MKLQQAFDVPAPPDEALALLLDAERVVPCMPGAKLEEIVDETTWKASIGVKLGPVGLAFRADITIEALDEAARTATLVFRGSDTRGKGGARGTVDARVVEGDNGGSRVEMDTELKFSGLAARVGRPNIVKSVSQTMVGRFGNCLKSQLEKGAVG
ncbi:MAG: SRPBCC family protein [Thermoleophilia bacterium]|nr:SRPBCC family protein [Thermoleophilia bacterium]